MLKKILLGLLVIAVATTMASASIKLGVKDIQANATGIEYVIDSSPISFTIGGVATSADTYLVTGSAVHDSGFGADVIYIATPATSTYVVNGLVRKELKLGSGFSVVGDLYLVSYADATSAVALLPGGIVGLRLEIL